MVLIHREHTFTVTQKGTLKSEVRTSLVIHHSDVLALDFTFVEGASNYVNPHISFDSMSGFVTRYDNMSVEYKNNRNVFEYSLVSLHFPMIASPTPITKIHDIDDVGGQDDSLSGKSRYDYDSKEKKVMPVSCDTKS